MEFPLEVLVKNPSTFSFSRSEYCHSARSNQFRLYFTLVSSTAVNLYVASGGKNASFAAIRPGNGGQQNRQHSSLKLKKCVNNCYEKCKKKRKETYKLILDATQCTFT